jgi:hypothetical protein
MMSFDLRIRCSGLMMWVPQGGTTMHVLMPGMVHRHAEGERAHGGGHQHDPAGMPAHYACLVYDVAYEKPGATQLAREYQMVHFKRGWLDLTGVRSPEGIDLSLPDELPNMNAMTDGVDPVLVQETRDERLAGRVTFTSGVLTDYQLGALFTFESDVPQRISPVTEWTIRRVSDSGGADAKSLAGLVVKRSSGEDEPLHELHPIGQTIHLELFNVTRDFLPPYAARFKPDAEDDTDPHFSAYYELCRGVYEIRPPRGTKAKEVVVRNKVPLTDGLVPGGDKRQNAHRAPGSICGNSKGTLAAE